MVRASDNPSRRRLEMIEYPDGEDLIDHRGRSKPIYKPSTPRPSEWKPGPMARLLLGIFPGLRLMVLKSVPAGLPYALLGLLAGLGALLLVLNWSASTAIIHELRIQPKWILLRGAAVLVLVAVYELLRLGAAVEEQNGGPWTPRIFAAAVLPSFVVVLGTPAVIDTAPKMLESTWLPLWCSASALYPRRSRARSTTFRAPA